jgi:hypothetical protein
MATIIKQVSELTRYLVSSSGQKLALLGGILWLIWGTAGFAQSDPDTTSSDKKYEFRRQEVFQYSNRGRRDPFKPLIQEGMEPTESSLLNVEEATLTGIIWAGDRMVALFKDKKGISFYMHEGDEIQNGRIAQITEKSVIVSVFGFGGTERLELKVSERSPGVGN